MTAHRCAADIQGTLLCVLTAQEVRPQKAALDDLTPSAAASGDLTFVPQSWALPFLSVALPSLSPVTFTQIFLPSQEAVK